MKALTVVAVVAAAVFVLPRLVEPQLATITKVYKESPLPTLEPSPVPSPTPTPLASQASPSPSIAATPRPKPSPVANGRDTYVQEQLIASGFDPVAVTTLFGDTRLKLYPSKVVAYKAPDWNAVKNRIYNAAYVQKGKNYIEANRAAFESMERDYGISKEVIAGLIATETDFGDHAGSTITFNALYSRMRQWSETTWKGQAAQLIALSEYCLEAKLDCFGIKGSYAGAIGIVQFMPNNLEPYGVDADSNGVVDLFVPADAIPSAAKFLIGHGWNEDQTKALARYYGSSIGYPEIVLHYASLLKE